MIQLFFKMFFFLSLLLPLQAETGIPMTEAGKTISKLIEKVKQSSGDERRKAMNALKLKLRSVNTHTRQQAMMQLKKSYAAGNPDIHTKQVNESHSTQQHVQVRHMQNISVSGNPPAHTSQTPVRGNTPHHPPQSPPRRGHP